MFWRSGLHSPQKRKIKEINRLLFLKSALVSEGIQLFCLRQRRALRIRGGQRRENVLSLALKGMVVRGTAVSLSSQVLLPLSYRPLAQ